MKIKRFINCHKGEIVNAIPGLVLIAVIIIGTLVCSANTRIDQNTKEANGITISGQGEEQESEKKQNDVTKSRSEEDKENADQKSKEQEKKIQEEENKVVESRKKEEDKVTTETVNNPNTSDIESSSTVQTDAGSVDSKVNNTESSNTGSSQPSQSSQPASTPVQKPSAQSQPTQPEPQPTQPEPQPVQPEPQSEPEPVWHEPIYESRWIVDQAAWDETVNEPIYDEVSKAICNTCGADITADIGGHGYNHMINGENASYSVVTETIQTGTNTYVIHHDEVGHWENVLVQEGYWG